MSLRFRAFDAGDGTSGVWARAADAVWPELHAATNPAANVTDAQARQVVGEHLPELLPVLDRLAGVLDRPGAAALLSHLTLKSPFAGCTQTSVEGALVRNYDFEVDLCDRTIVRSHFLRPVLGMNDVLWGLLDGVNDAGLAVSLTYGGRPEFRPGLSVLLVVRYLLETCDTVAEAWAKVQRLPFATVQNLTLVDRSSALSVFVGPDRAAAVAPEVCIANHQDRPVSPEQERGSATGARQRAIQAATLDGSVEKVVDALLRPPAYVPLTGTFGTLYTAIYRPAEGRVTYVWPDARVEQSLTDFTSGEWVVLQ
jgi:predicted choloylglycine hydrolase